VVRVLNCQYIMDTISPATAAAQASAPNWVEQVQAATRAAAETGAGAAIGTNCDKLAPGEWATFDHIAVYHPNIPTSSYGGLGSMPGREVLMNGMQPVVGFIQHELGHNFGFKHTQTVPVGFNNVRVEYGDITDTMGDGANLRVHDFNAGLKHGVGWLPDSRMINLDSQAYSWRTQDPSSVLATVASRSFLLAAIDRNTYTIGDGGVSLGAKLPPATALTARAPVPPRAHFRDSPGEPVYLYASYRAAAVRPGVYLSETPQSPTTTGNPVLFCHRDATCHDQLPVAPGDAVVYDPAGMALLVTVGAPVPAFPSPDGTLPALSSIPAVDTALPVRMAYLGWNGLPLDKAASSDFRPTAYSTATVDKVCAEAPTLWDSVELSPALLPGLEWLNATFESPRGRIAVSLHRLGPEAGGGAVRVSATVPPGVQGVLVLPRSARRLSLQGGQELLVED
jgi:hypothetical protein